MSRGYPSSFISAVTSDGWNPAMMIRIALGTTDVELWTGSTNLSFESGTFIGAGGLIGVSSIEEGPLEARSVTFTFTGQGSGIYQQLQANRPKGKKLSLWLAAMNDAHTALAAGDSYIKVNEFYISKSTLRDNESGWTVELECETEFARLFRSNHKYYSNLDQQSLYAGDTFFRFISKLPGITVPWGKSGGSPGGSYTGGSAAVGRPGWGKVFRD